MAAKSQWTVLTYIAAHNNLQKLGMQSLMQIIQTGSTPQVMHGFLLDTPQGAKRGVVGDAGLVLAQETVSAFDSGDPRRLVETARWLFAKYPAERYALVLWSHGTGWQPEEIEAVGRQVHGAALVSQAESRAAAPGSLLLFRTSLARLLAPARPADRAILFDDGSGHSLDTLELARVAQALQQSIGQRLSFVGMDACLMASAEVVSQLHGAVAVVAASEELVPGHSWPYDRLYGGLRANPHWSAAELGRQAVAEYVAAYTQHPPAAGDVTLAALDLDQMPALTAAIDALAGALLAEMPSQAAVLWAAQKAARTQETAGRQQNKFNYHLWDAGTLAANLAAHPQASPAVVSAAQALGQALRPGQGVVLAEGHRGEHFAGIAGLTLYALLPANDQQLSPYYRELRLAQETRWASMLQAYHTSILALFG